MSTPLTPQLPPEIIARIEKEASEYAAKEQYRNPYPGAEDWDEIEANKVIAEFMGWEFREVAMGIEFWKGNDCQFMETKEHLPKFLSEYVKYHSDWSWIMPVWIKFRKLWTDRGAMGIAEEKYYSEWLSSLEYYLCSSDESARFAERLYYAILWYNKQKES